MMQILVNLQIIKCFKLIRSKFSPETAAIFMVKKNNIEVGRTFFSFTKKTFDAVDFAYDKYKNYLTKSFVKRIH